MVVVADAFGEPDAVVVKSIAAGVTEFTVLGAVWDHNLFGACVMSE